MAGGAVAIAGFLPDVTENLVSDQPVLQGGYGRERLVGRRGRVGRIWWSVGVENAGVGKRNQEKLTQFPFCRVGGTEFRRY